MARSSALAVRNTFKSAAGKTTVPISRPSATSPGAAAKARWRANSAARTAAIAATREAASPAASVLRSVRDLAAFEQDALAGRRPRRTATSMVLGEPASFAVSSSRYSAPLRSHPDQAIERAAIEQMPAQPGREHSADGALARPARTVDRHDGHSGHQAASATRCETRTVGNVEKGRKRGRDFGRVVDLDRRLLRAGSRRRTTWQSCDRLRLST